MRLALLHLTHLSSLHYSKSIDYNLQSSVEQRRLNKQHFALRSLMGNRIKRAPLPTRIDVILDIGCGTGVVTRELSVMYPLAQHIYGIDLSLVPSTAVSTSTSNASELSSNVSFIGGDARQIMGTDTCLPFGTADFVFNQLLLCGMTDWEGYVRDVFKMVKPGGWVEMQDYEEMFYINGKPVDIDRFGPWRWLWAFRAGAKAKGIDLDYSKNMKSSMLNAGFTGVDARQFTVPFWRANDNSPEANSIADYSIRDPDGYFWHAISKMVDSLGFSDSEIA